MRILYALKARCGASLNIGRRRSWHKSEPVAKLPGSQTSVSAMYSAESCSTIRRIFRPISNGGAVACPAAGAMTATASGKVGIRKLRSATADNNTPFTLSRNNATTTRRTEEW